MPHGKNLAIVVGDHTYLQNANLKNQYAIHAIRKATLLKSAAAHSRNKNRLLAPQHNNNKVAANLILYSPSRNKKGKWGRFPRSCFL